MTAKRKSAGLASTPAETLAACLSKYEPEIAALAVGCLERLRKLVPGATELVYDAYNALAIPFGSSDRLGDTFVGITVYPEHVNLNFLRGSRLDDPEGLLVGTGSWIRHIRVDDEAMLDRPAVKRLVRAALAEAGFRGGRGKKGEILIKSIYARQRPRRPG